MKKSLMLFSLLIIFLSASFASAKVSLSESKTKAIPALSGMKSEKNKALNKICFFRCEQELANLNNAEANWELICSEHPNSIQCAQAQRNLENAGNAYNHCVDPEHWGPEGPLVSRKMRMIDRKKQIGSNADDIG